MKENIGKTKGDFNTEYMFNTGKNKYIPKSGLDLDDVDIPRISGCEKPQSKKKPGRKGLKGNLKKKKIEDSNNEKLQQEENKVAVNQFPNFPQKKSTSNIF